MVKHALVLALAALAGCIEPPTFERCGDLACPAGTSCVAERCVTAGQLAACAGLTDEDVCSLDNAVGACHGGICDPTGCGNGRVDSAEVCDDDNTIFGDGCSGDCRSLETCGNGIVDVAVGETCDCGTDAAALPAGCQFANSDSLEAECSPSCELRYCGNDTLDRLEQCDGNEVGAATCSDFGYYAGTLGCLGVCRFDTTSCIGRCGDLSVDPVYGEFCDGQPPEGSCLTFDYDAGAIACSSTCTPAVDQCERFGWQIVDTAAPRSMWARGRDTLMIAADSSSAWITIDSLREVAPAGTYRVATGAPDGNAFAVGDTTVAVWNGAEWSTLAGAWGGKKPVAAWASTGLGLYVVSETGELWHHDGAWENQQLTNIVGVTGDASAAYAWSTSGVWTSTGGAWTAVSLPAFTGSIVGFVSGTQARWLGVAGTTLFRETSGVWSGAISSVEPFTQMSGTTAGDVLLAPSLRRMFADDRPSDRLGGPGVVTKLATGTFDDGILAMTSTTTYRLRTGGWSRYFFIYDDTYLADANSFHLGSAGGKAIHAGDIAWYAPPGTDYYDFAYDQPFYFDDFTEAIDQVLIFATDEYGEPGLYLRDIDGNPVAVATGAYRQLRNARDGSILGAGDEVLAVGGLPTADAGWQVHALTGYTVIVADRLLDGSYVAAAKRKLDAMHVLLAISTTGTVTEIAGTQRAAVWANLWLAPDDTIYAVGDNTLWIRPPGGSATTTEFAGAILQSVGGTGNDDVFVGGYAPPFGTFSGMAHYDGTSWQPVRPAANTRVPFLYVTETLVRYVFGREEMSLQRVIRW